MIAQVVRNDRLTILGKTHRLFTTCAAKANCRSPPSTAPVSHGKRFLQTSLNEEAKFTKSSSPPQWNFKFGSNRQDTGRNANSKSSILSDYTPSKWSSYSLPSKQILKTQQKEAERKEVENKHKLEAAQEAVKAADDVSKTVSSEPAKKRKRRTLRPRKALITLSPKAISHLRGLLDQPEPKLIRIGVTNRGCSGLTYDLQYISEPGKFDEVVEQDGVKIIIDSKALFSVVGSEMDWVDDKLSSRFVFKNPNSKGTCGCGESFMV